MADEVTGDPAWGRETHRASPSTDCVTSRCALHLSPSASGRGMRTPGSDCGPTTCPALLSPRLVFSCPWKRTCDTGNATLVLQAKWLALCGRVPRAGARASRGGARLVQGHVIHAGSRACVTRGHMRASRGVTCRKQEVGLSPVSTLSTSNQ